MLHAPVLQLDLARMHEIDPRNVENLFGMWTVFSKCSSTIPDGKRLENLSWRVWARETLCCPPQPDKTIVPAIDIPRASKEDLPSLSFSPGSDTSENCSLGSSQNSLRNSALSKSRGKEQHLTPTTLEKIIKNIQGQEQDHEPLDPAIEAVVNGKMSPEKRRKQSQSPVSDGSDQRSINYTTESSGLSTMTTSTTATTVSPVRTVHRESDSSASSDGLIRSGSVVHGFSPLPSLRSRGSSTIIHNLPILATRNVAKNIVPKTGGMFTLGGSSEDDESSFDTTMSYRKTLLEPRKSSLSRSVTRDQPHEKKKTSFKEIVEQHQTETGGSEADDNAIASDDDESDMDDSVIGDDDEDQWEDEQAEEEKPLHNPVFKRVDSAAHLPSRRSVLTAGLTEGDRAKGLLSAASKSTSALRRLNRAASHEGPSMPGSPENNNDEDGPMMMRVASNSRPIQISSPTNAAAYALAHSPRTTRRYMLSTELTESLRKNLLWERQQKNTTVNAFLKREARSMANLPRAGQMAAASASATLQPPRANLEPDAARHNSFNDYFNVTNEYHSKGW